MDAREFLEKEWSNTDLLDTVKREGILGNIIHYMEKYAKEKQENKKETKCQHTYQ